MDRRMFMDVGCWYTESWCDEDLELALENAEIPVTEENISKLGEACKGIFDDKSERNEMIAQMARETFGKEV